MKSFILFFVVGLAACAPGADRVIEALRKHGFSDVEVGGRDFFECSQGDMIGRAFTAVNPRGETVEGTVCCGVFKSCTVRF